MPLNLKSRIVPPIVVRSYNRKDRSARAIFFGGTGAVPSGLGRDGGRPRSYKVVAEGASGETRSRIGSMCDSKKPWRLKKFWERSSGRSVRRVIRKNFFCFAK